MTIGKVISFAIAALLVSVAGMKSGLAVPVQSCAPGSGFECIVTKGDVLAGGLVVPNSGNDQEIYVEAAIELVTGNPIDLMLLGKSDEPSTFIVTPTDPFSGTWMNTVNDFVGWITVKAANSFVIFEVNPAALSGIYNTGGILNNGGQMAAVSHISFWKGVEDVPEVGAFILTALGLSLLPLARRRSAI